ncbi:MAG TPA: hypothetical protein VN618_15865 [Solirubrobacteraceae bacterium]|nr:hypothetical protein [Solirubrobacteraceae bacterium]
MITDARAGPASAIRTLKITNAIAVQSSPSTTTEAIAPPLGRRPGAVSAAGRASAPAATARLAPIVARGSSASMWRLRISGPTA